MSEPAVARKLGLIGPILVGVGAAVAALGAWYVVHARPEPGAVIDRVPGPDGTELVVRAEAGGGRSFLELHDPPPAGGQPPGELRWSAYIPHYAGAPGRPAIAWSPTAITVRVERDGHAEVFGFAARDATKIGSFRLAPEHEPIATQPDGPLTLTDHERSYELVGGAGWHQLVAIDLESGKGLWKVELGGAPIASARVEAGRVVVAQDARARAFDARTGAPITP